MSERIFEEKNRIRTELRTRREGLDPKIQASLSKKITEKLMSLDEFSGGKAAGLRFSLFKSFGGEVDLSDFHACLEAQAALIYYPVIEEGIMYMGEMDYKSRSVFVEGELGIKEPSDFMRELVPMDVVIIPGLAFSLKGGRIGFGKAYYDRYLASYPPGKRPLIVAPAYDFQVFEDFPLSDHDMPLDILVTETFIHRVDMEDKIKQMKRMER